MTELVLPLTSTGRKYGYITWPKERDEEVRQLLGEGELILSLPRGERRGQVDWKHHRISIGYSATRSLSEEVHGIRVKRTGAGRVEIAFLV